jgi:hypothetical protein
MADLSSITAVRPTATTTKIDATYGATIAAGQSVYKDTADGDKWKLADADNTTVTAGSGGVGIAMTPGVDDGKGIIATGGSVILVGTTMAVGTTYIVSDTPGGIKPTADAASGDNVTLLGNAATTTQLDITAVATGNQVP